MSLAGWLLYIALGIGYFLIISFLSNKYNLTKIEKIVISIILLMIPAGIFFKYNITYTSDMFLIFVFLLVVDVIYSSYFVERDFFDKSESNVIYYIVLIIIGFFINQEFINDVDSVFLTGSDLRIILWFLVIVFIYNFSRERNILTGIDKYKDKYMSVDGVLVNYTKLKYKYYDVCNYKINDLVNLIYAIMIFENNKRSKILRNYDYFMFRLNGNPRKLGIMQIESKKFITDIESIDIVYKKLEKEYNKCSNRDKIDALIKKCYKDDYDYIKYIYGIIKDF